MGGRSGGSGIRCWEYTDGWQATNLLEESPFLNNVGNGLLANATSFVDVFEGIKFFGALMLDDPHL